MIGVMLAIAALSADEPALDAFLETFAEQRAELRSLQAHFTQRNLTRSFRGEVDEHVREGVLVYVRPRRLVFHYADIIMLIDGRNYYEYEVDMEQIQIMTLDNDPQMEALFLGFEENVEELRKAYELTLIEPEPSACAEVGLELTPKLQPDEENAAAPLFERVRLFLRAEDYLPCAVHTVNDPEASVELDILDITVNPELDRILREIYVPEGTMVIQDDKLVRTVGPDGEYFPPMAIVPADPAGVVRDEWDVSPLPSPSESGDEAE